MVVEVELTEQGGSEKPLVGSSDVTIGLIVNCGCLGSEHRVSCDLVTRLPVPTNSKPGKLFIQIGGDIYSISKFIVI